ncbi:RNA polymerase sigma factor [Gluconacetobacter asukensis]|nr:sigma-70 family RNA polymerase sigma factor [Gluconacetobacter asukensis]
MKIFANKLNLEPWTRSRAPKGISMGDQDLGDRSVEAARRQPVARNNNDALLVERIRARDMVAFEELYRGYYDRLARFVLKRVHRPHLVEEVVNDTLMVVWDHTDSFKGDSRLSTWIFGIAYRKSMKALRNHQDPMEDENAESQVSPELSPEDNLGRRRNRELLLEAMEGLSVEHREVLELTYFQEFGYQEIADIMSCPVGTVKTRMFHARRQLRRLLDGTLPDWI